MISDPLPFIAAWRSSTSGIGHDRQSRNLQIDDFARRTATAVMAGLALLAGSAGPAPAQRRTCRWCATPRSKRWCATMRGRSSRRQACPRPASSIVLVNDQSFNAFVDGRRIFINTGALMTAETPNEIIGVHRPRDRPPRRRPPAEPARAAGARQTMAIIATLLGVGAMVAGAATDNQSAWREAGIGVAGRRRRDGAARPARLSAQRGD